jgi:restriction system protein
MAKKKKPAEEQIIIGRELSLDEWLSHLGTDKWDSVFPKNCFPTDKHKEEYLLRIREVDERALRNLARSFLIKSGNYGVDKDHLTWVIEHYGAEVFVKDQFRTEFDRRSLPKNGPQWEGITWVLDLLPDKPLDAISSIRAYVRAHIQYFTDYMFYGHNDVVDMIQARYHVVARHSCFISFGGPDEEFARMLYDSLRSVGVEAFFFPTHAMPGKDCIK